MSTDDTTGTVSDLDQFVDLDLDAQPDDPRAAYPAFRVRIGSHTYSLEAPDAGLVMELEEARMTRVFLALAFDEQWKAVEQTLATKSPEALLTLIRSYGQHFDLDQAAIMAQAAPNRAERRRRRRGR